MQPVIVRKYGGTSVGSVGRIRRIARRLAREHRRGAFQVVVVSAMAKTTDRILGMARKVSRQPRERELDMMLTTGEQLSCALLAMAVQEMGIGAVSLTGAQCGILTDGNHFRARIRDIRTDRIRSALEAGNVVVAAGFQGITSEQEITTLGRGGSDVTAVALAAALGASRCEIYTDVDGVFTADPRVVPEARLLSFIGYEEMLEYAASGSKVLHPRSVEIAHRFQVPLEVRSSFHGRPGTLVVKEEKLEKVAITGVSGDARVARIALSRVRDVPGVAARVARKLADVSVGTRFIIQGVRHDETNDISLIVSEDDAEHAVEALREMAEEVGTEEILVDRQVATVSVVGSGVASDPEVAARLFGALAAAGINIELISSSAVRIACVIREDRMEEAVRAVHRTFDLEHLERRPLDVL